MTKRIKKRSAMVICTVCDRRVPMTSIMKIPEKKWFVCMDCWLHIQKMRGVIYEPKKD